LLLSNTNDLHSRKFRVQFAEPLALFKHLVLSHEVGQRKPLPEVYGHAVKLAGCAPRELLFVDDMPENVAAARAAGWNGIVFTSVDELRRNL
jgi:putative hydrolase of the HAD superfamily